ncbi:DJ-1/PfpI family protein [Bosea sp. (in: a-proteobacteria)]|uniref:DJ-1/PfpI family protein n=1 Tax=Bosea sp. (in: a-proteobacteria) TaxID=1871050 RepID=UPI002736B041|nr:DJ-1/PfpI family protein [Bosea sp. (in: a-proteobacteria)]MDP3410379.1 DJ-1/PfpI family protein [Bosea sp. (in: a-proteobacteria)]
MTITRRQFSTAAVATSTIALALAKEGAAGAARAQPSAPPAIEHDMSSMPAHWVGKEQIAFLIYPEFTALDMVGPHHMLASLMGATVHLVAKTKEPVKSDQGLVFTPSATFDECPRDLDILCIPGGAQGSLAAMLDEATIAFVKDRGSRAKRVTSVCTGSLILGMAGLLDGYKATTHWAATSVLPLFGAIPTEGRIVQDRNRVTGGGVTAGIDFGLTLVGELRDREYAECVQLLAEYAPQPPFNAGTPATAPEPVVKMMSDMMVGFLAGVTTAAARPK